jgi:amino acid adenylation domain-containing protein
MSAQRRAVQARLAKLSPERRALLDRLVGKDSGLRVPSRIGKRPPGVEVPLSFAQQRLWFFEQLSPGTAVYNMPLQVRLPFAVDHGALLRALDEVVRRHEILRTRFGTVSGKPVQTIATQLKLELPVSDLGALPPSEREAALANLALQESKQPFDLAVLPLIRVRLVVVDAQDHAMLLTMHHIVSDAHSVAILFQELTALYAAFAAKQSSPLPERTLQYGDFAVWQRDWLRGELLEREVAYWKEHLRGIVPIELPYDRPRPPTPSFRGGSVPVTLAPDLVARLRTLSSRHACTLFITMLAAFQVLLLRHTGQDNVVVGTPVANRHQPELQGMIGFFINSLVMRCDLGGNPPFREAILRVREIALGAYAHQAVPFEMLVEALQPERDLTRNPLFQVLFQLQNAGRRAADPIGAPGGGAPHDNAVFDLNVNLWDLSDGIAGAFEYNAELFDAPTVERLASHFGVLLRAIVDDPDRKIGALAILAADERRQVVEEWNSTARDYPGRRTVIDLVREQACRTPGAPAVAEGGRELDYAALVRRSTALASRLRAHGARHGERIGILFERSSDAIVAILGVLASGAAYVPLDPEAPIERLRFMLGDAGMRAVVTSHHLQDRLSNFDALLVVGDERECVDTGEIDALPEVGPDDIAYVIYTSGSTGIPKGVVVPHRALLSSTCARMAYYADPVGRFLLLSPFAFDSSIAGIFWTLCTGGCVDVVPTDETGDPAKLAAVLLRRRATHLLAVPSLYQHLLNVLDVALPRLQVAIVAGEPCPAALVRGHVERLPDVALYNEYGPTEATVWATVHRCGAEDGEGRPPIGRPIPNARAYIVDGNGEPAPIGVAGELWIGGDGVASGYLNREQLTAERFVADPFRADGSRLYRTGDRALFRIDGAIEFLGRLDEQVKVRGYRIELGEVEATLREHPAVVDCAAFVWTHDGDVRLAASVVVHSGQVDAEALGDFAMLRLPGYMVPSLITFVGALPRNSNGKLDRAALVADPGQSRHSNAHVAPRNEVEQVIASIYRELLGVDDPSVDDSFYLLGGHSLLATQLLSRVNDTFQLRLALPLMFEADTVASLAQVVERRLVDEIAGMPDAEVERLTGQSHASASTTSPQNEVSRPL